MTIQEADQILAGRSVEFPSSRGLTFRVTGATADGMPLDNLSIVAPAGYIAHAAAVKYWTIMYGAGINDVQVRPSNGGAFVGVVVK